MIKHLVLRKLNDSYSTDEKERIKRDCKIHLEALLGKMPGALRIECNIYPLESSTVDMFLDSEFESIDLLQAYSIHPKHQEVVKTYILPFVNQCTCFDYTIQ